MTQLELFSTDSNNSANTFDLPDADVTLYSTAFTTASSDRFLDVLKQETPWQQDEIVMYGKKVSLPRLTAWYGDPGRSYTYSGIRMEPHPWTPTLSEIKKKVEQLAQVSFNSVLLNFYRHGGDYVSWHADDEAELNPDLAIASVSFGGTRRFVMKHKTKVEVAKLELELTHGSLLLMGGGTQQHWLHQVPKTKKKVDPRINLTFRVIR